MEKVLAEMRDRLVACAKTQAAGHLRNAYAHLDHALVWLKAPQGADAEGEAFWTRVANHLSHTAAALDGNEDSLRWLVENCPVDFSAKGSDPTKTFADQARARLMKLKEPQKVAS